MSFVLPTRRLSQFSVSGLFGEFNYPLSLRNRERVTAIIAPNGRGKTVCLRLIHALFKRRWEFFKATEFTELTYKFDAGETIVVSKLQSALGAELTSPQEFGIVLSIIWPNGTLEWRPKLSDSLSAKYAAIDRALPFVSRVSPDRWMHDFTSQIYSAAELIETFAEHIPQHILASLYDQEPGLLREIISSIDCHLIETQRLLIISGEERGERYSRERRPPSTLAISQKAKLLASIISEELKTYANLSQSLDSSFPRRVIEHSAEQGWEPIPGEDLKEDLQKLEGRRQQLIAAGILDANNEEQVNLPGGGIGISLGQLLSIYVLDTQKKLDSLSRILSKVQTFKYLIEQRLYKKTISISKDAGFKIFSAGREIPIEKLSSGEQHQLVLFFELLFELKHNALILIDEPELSLHVSWQRKFIGDLLRIIDVNGFDVVLATHSPQLVAKWPQLLIDLGSVDEQDA